MFFCTVLPPFGLQPFRLFSGWLATLFQLDLGVRFLLLHFPTSWSSPLYTGQCPSKAHGHPDTVPLAPSPTSPHLTLLALTTLLWQPCASVWTEGGHSCVLKGQILNIWSLWIIWMISHTTIQLCCSVNTVMDNMWTNECYCVLVLFYLRTLKFDFILFSCMAIFLFITPFNHLEMILTMYVIEKQFLDWIWH